MNIRNKHKIIKIVEGLLYGAFLSNHYGIGECWISLGCSRLTCTDVYKSVCEPKESEVLFYSHKVNNIYERFAIRTCLTDENGKEKVIGHLPLELSRFTKYLLDLGAIVIVKLNSTHYSRSVVVQGGLKTPYMVKVKMIPTK